MLSHNEHQGMLRKINPILQPEMQVWPADNSPADDDRKYANDF